MSHPTRVRGLKHKEWGCFIIGQVAPHTGAWIETLLLITTLNIYPVAPHTGAWIETAIQRASIQRVESHPTRVRGLKQSNIIKEVIWIVVAPHTGAWIETMPMPLVSCEIRSHPTRVRGLKHNCQDNTCFGIVAPHTGAWIETTHCCYR